MEISRFDDGSVFTTTWGYCRAVRAGDHIAVSGTTGMDANGTAVGDTGEQARVAIARIAEALDGLVGPDERAVVIRTRTFMVDPSEWEQVAPHHRAAFGAEPPASTLVGTTALLGDGLTIEIEADAVVVAA